jgi:hypothetical protein
LKGTAGKNVSADLFFFINKVLERFDQSSYIQYVYRGYNLYHSHIEVYSSINVGFEVFTAVSMKIAVFWVVAPCSLVEVYQRFRGP